MAADSSVSHTLFFIAAVLVAGSLAGVFIGLANDMSQTMQERGDAISEQLQTDITIINDPVAVPYSDSTLTLYVKNTGTSTLSRNSLTILVDGLYQNYTVSGAAGDPSWVPQKVLEIEMEVVLLPGDHGVKVVTANGVADEMRFRI
jgi:flagellar protein FlaG